MSKREVYEGGQAAFSVDDVMRISGLGRTSIYNEIRSGRLSAKKCGRRTLVLASDLDSWLQRLPSLSTACRELHRD